MFSQITSEDLLVFDNYFYNLKSLEFKSATKTAEKVQNNKTNQLLKILAELIEDDGQSLLNIISPKLDILNDEKKNTDLQESVLNLILATYHLNYFKNKTESFIFYRNSLSKSVTSKNKILEKYVLFSILKFYLKGVIHSSKTQFEEYLIRYNKLCNDDIDWLYYYYFSFNLLCQTETYNENTSDINNSLFHILKKYDSLISNSKKLNKTILYYYRDKGNFIIRKKPLEAEKNYKKSNSYFTESNFYKVLKFSNYSNLTRAYILKKEYKKGLETINFSKKYINTNDSLLYLYDINSKKASIFNHLKLYDSAYYYEKKVRFLTYEINFQKENKEVSELKVALDTEKKEKENLQLKQENIEEQQKNKQKQNFLIGSLVFILLGGTIATLSLKNSKRKRKLAEQEKELETQKNLTLLKEQEITTINAMVEGQEKERKRVAEDLHDNLGSVLATLKLHFENLKMNKEKKKIYQDDLFNKTENLIDEAYLKVRKIAHAENAGVIANQGLLVAVQMMAEKISSADKIKIDVIGFGLDIPIENSLEITIFRIIQELTTNILKHAEAKNATINIALYDKNLNIIIEDDGKGFDEKKANQNNGMGINSIKTRVEHLNGAFEIDSTIGKGSSIIINIPIL